MTIQSFKNKETEDIACGFKNKNTVKILPSDLHYVAYKKLIFLDNATSLKDLQAWPSLMLEKLLGARSGQYSVRINSKYRICFEPSRRGFNNVEIIDYHR